MLTKYDAKINSIRDKLSLLL
ncbi:MAG: hypothetical protein QG617_788, partial [Campylobacterota bacterium]|nr:hypothetical protein [Campylobacterota bacterium]